MQVIANPNLPVFETEYENGKPLVQIYKNLTDSGNAERLAYHSKNEFRFIGGRWYLYDGRRWIPDTTQRIEQKAKETIRSLYAEAAQVEDESRQREIVQWALRSDSIGRRLAMIRLAESELSIDQTALDVDENVFNLNNGVLDLVKDEFLEHDPAFMLSKLSPVDYDPKATAPTWDAFLDKIFAGNKTLINFLARALGWCLSGGTEENVFFVFYGHGANGKTTLVNAIAHVLGDYALDCPVDTFMTRREGGIPNDLARLHGARLLVSNESAAGRKLDESLIKRLTGRDAVTARFLHQEFFTFYPTFKIFMLSNYKPVIRGVDLAIWRRVRLIPFNVTIPRPEQDLKLLEKLKAEAAGILNWLIAGYADFKTNGLGNCDEVEKATDKYKKESDILGDFLDSFEFDEIKNSKLYANYEAYCRENGDHPLSGRVFGRMLEERGIERRKKNDGSWWRKVTE